MVGRDSGQCDRRVQSLTGILEQWCDQRRSHNRVGTKPSKHRDHCGWELVTARECRDYCGHQGLEIRVVGGEHFENLVPDRMTGADSPGCTGKRGPASLIV